MEVKKIVTSFLKYKGKILLLKRSEGRDFGGKWAAVSGYLEIDENPLERALQEIKEETGIENPKLAKKGNPIKVRDYSLKIIFYITPFLFEVDSDKALLDREHSEFRWVSLEEIKNYETVPKLKEVLENILKS